MRKDYFEEITRTISEMELQMEDGLISKEEFINMEILKYISI